MRGFSSFMKRPKPPYFAVIFSSKLRSGAEGYEKTAERMVELVSARAGFLGMRSFRKDTGEGVTISYWENREAIQAWREDPEHQEAMRRARSEWYESFDLEIAEVTEARKK